MDNAFSSLNYIYNDLIDMEELKNRKVILFGAGLDGQIAFDYFKLNDIDISFYCDNNKKKQNTILNGIKVISPDDLKKIENRLVFITVKMKLDEIKLQLKELGIEYLIFSEYVMKTDFKANMEKYMYVYNNLLVDEKSKKVYKIIIESRLTGDISKINEIYEDNEFYCLPNFKNISNEVFVDAGAYVGDTIEQFIWNCTGRFKKIYGFEPGLKQFEAMNIRIDRLVREWGLKENQIECINAGLAENNEKLPFFESDDSLLTSNFICGDTSKEKDYIQVYSLDEYLKNDKVTMIKVDIEGFEFEMLKGSKKTIEYNQPKLAISIYHRYEDLYKLPIYINELMPSYKMAIRHHSTDLTETVLYCWVE